MTISYLLLDFSGLVSCEFSSDTPCCFSMEVAGFLPPYISLGRGEAISWPVFPLCSPLGAILFQMDFNTCQQLIDLPLIS